MKSDKIIAAVEGVTKKWAKQRKREERERSAYINRRIAMTRTPTSASKMRSGLHAGSLVEGKRRWQASGARPADHVCSTAPHHRDRRQGIRQGLRPILHANNLPDYIEQYGCDWNVVYDARGNFAEPHTDERFGLGTLQARDYLRGIEAHEISDLSFFHLGKCLPNGRTQKQIWRNPLYRERGLHAAVSASGACRAI